MDRTLSSQPYDRIRSRRQNLAHKWQPLVAVEYLPRSFIADGHTAGQALLDGMHGRPSSKAKTVDGFVVGVSEAVLFGFVQTDKSDVYAWHVGIGSVVQELADKGGPLVGQNVGQHAVV
jgi:hypothetical protein